MCIIILWDIAYWHVTLLGLVNSCTDNFNWSISSLLFFSSLICAYFRVMLSTINFAHVTPRAAREG